MPSDKNHSQTASISPELLDMLVCPESYQPLAPAEPELIARLNGAIVQGKVVNRAGQPLAGAIEAGLVRQDRTLLYVVADGIPIMLADEAIPLEQLS